ncbi:EVE domain-containing protein [Natronorubrum tibetense]|uniref:EVE domain-containing protein n=1 Tax=Natronorubrum tibetense GA33 TaxID=1114856 RepID=L9VRS3_9EURY|nr:EVE domain-containing protein [Natronorubrum tibetense]ELY39864.1 hypothetical protein C496_14341 [Natronorubrum tibetense GA33]
MTQDLFRITVDEPNYGQLLASPPTDTLFDKANFSTQQGARLWAQKSNEKGQKLYDTMKPGDGLLFYKVKRGIADDEQLYVGVGRVGEKHRLTEAQAETFFRTSVATLAYTVTDFQPIRKPVKEIETILGYSSYPQSSHRVVDNRYNTIDEVLQKLSQ